MKLFTLSKIMLASIGICIFGSMSGRNAYATPAHKASFERYFGQFLSPKLRSCATCHVAASAPGVNATLASFPHNPFGKRLAIIGEDLRKAGKRNDMASRLTIALREESLGKGSDNLDLILLGHPPGDSSDKLTQSEQSKLPGIRAAFVKFASQYRWDPFSKVTRPAIPAISAYQYPNPIDHFLEAERMSRNLKPSPRADKLTVLRRVTLDLTGLQPTKTEMADFLADGSPRAYEKVVERLLASPRYGERWGRQWMDVWRYSDWAGWADGGQIRDSQPHIWRWRDWIVESLNSDKPYDQMVREMLAADEIAPNDSNMLRATGFLVRNFKLLSREQWMEDLMNHSSKAFLGLTVHCAKCHNHVYDPITQADYYRMRAIFEPHNVRIVRVPGEPDTKKDGLVHALDVDPKAPTYLFIRGDERNPDKSAPMEPGIPPCIGGKLEIQPINMSSEFQSPARRSFEIEEGLKAAKSTLDSATKALESGKQKNLAQELMAQLKFEHEWALANLRSYSDTVRAEKTETSAKSSELEKAASAKEAWSSQKKEAVALAQKNLSALKADIYRSGLALKNSDPSKPEITKKLTADISAQNAKLPKLEMALAAAKTELAKPESTAFTHLYASPSPAISSGRRLAYAKWLTSSENPLTARVAVNQIWMRRFGVGIVPSVNDFGKNGRKPTHPKLLDWLAAELMDNHWQMKPIHKLMVMSDAYQMSSKDNADNLKLDPDNQYLWRMNSHRMEAEQVRDNLLFTSGVLDETMGGPEIDNNLGLSSRRRSIYLRHAAEKEVEFLQVFDGPSVTECYERKMSVMPQQALALANSQLTVTLSRKIAREEFGAASEKSDVINRLFQRLLCRPATSQELTECREFVKEQTEKFRSLTASNESSPETDYSKPSKSPGIHALESLALVLYNHSDFVTVR